MDFSTPKERARVKRNEAICQQYREIRDKNPEISRHRVTLVLSERHSMTPQNVVTILKACNLW